MAIKWEKINFDLIKRLQILAKSSFDNGDYLGASVLQILFLEGSLSLAVGLLLEQRDLEKGFADKYSQGYQSFNSLIDFFFLLSLDKEIYSKLREINKKRNKIIHNIFEFSTFDQILQESRELYLESYNLDTLLRDKYFPKKDNKEITN